MGSRGAAFLYLEALNLQAMAAGSGRGGCQRRELLGMCAARRQNSVTQLLVYLSSCARTVLSTEHSLRPNLTARKHSAAGTADRFPAFAAELALLLGDLGSGDPHTLHLSTSPLGTPTTSDQGVPVLHHSFDECCGCCRGHCTLREKQLRPQVGATASKAAQKVLYNCTFSLDCISLENTFKLNRFHPIT